MKSVMDGFLVVMIGVFITAGFTAEGSCASQLPTGAKYIALGGMTAAAVDDVYALCYNPAQLNALRSLQMAAEFTGMFVGTEGAPSKGFVAVGYPVKNIGIFGVYGNILDADGLYQECLFGAGYSYDDCFGVRGLGLGGTLKYFRYAVQAPGAVYDGNGIAISGDVGDPLLANGTSKAVFSCNLGALYRFDPHWSAGLGVDDLFEPNISLVNTPGVVLPRHIYAGVSAKFGPMGYNFDLGAVDNSYSAALGIQRSFSIPASVFASFKYTWRRYAARTIELSEPALGVSYSFEDFTLLYSVQYPLNGNVAFGDHTLSLVYKFKEPPQPSINKPDTRQINISKPTRYKTRVQ